MSRAGYRHVMGRPGSARSKRAQGKETDRRQSSLLASPRTKPGALQLSSLLSKPWCQLQFGIMILKGSRVVKLGWVGHRKTDKKRTLWRVLRGKGGQLRSWATESHGSKSLQECSGPGRAPPPLHAESCLFPSLRPSMPTIHFCENPFFPPRFFLAEPYSPLEFQFRSCGSGSHPCPSGMGNPNTLHCRPESSAG